VPTIEKASFVEKPPAHQLSNHLQGQFPDRFRIDPAGVKSGIIRTGNGGLAIEARVGGALTAEFAQVPWRLTAQALFIESVARTGAKQKGGEDAPPEMGTQITAKFQAAGIGQPIDPVVEIGESRQ
jgi:hypothetical protein